MVMMLTAGLGVSEMMIGWDNTTGVTSLVLSSDVVDSPLVEERRNQKNCSEPVYTFSRLPFSLLSNRKAYYDILTDDKPERFCVSVLYWLLY